MANEFDKRMDAFTKELTELCRKHDVMIGGGFAYASIITEGPGEAEAGWFTDHQVYLTWRESNDEALDE